jgi:hypothetical protein
MLNLILSIYRKKCFDDNKKVVFLFINYNKSFNLIYLVFIYSWKVFIIVQFIFIINLFKKIIL